MDFNPPNTSCTVLDDGAALSALTPEWTALWHANGSATPFQHPAWLVSWWSAFGTGQLRLATWREHGVLRGILPAYVLAEAVGAKLLPMGAGTTDYLDAMGDGVAPMLAALLDRCDVD